MSTEQLRENVSLRIMQHLADLDITQRELAARAGLQEKLISRIVAKRCGPSLYSAHRLAHAMGISLDCLVGEVDLEAVNWLAHALRS